MRNLDLDNYAEMTALANAQYGANWTVEEYSSAIKQMWMLSMLCNQET